jgi:hypothetical protein
MATVDKNFKVKNGLVVEGTSGTINGSEIITEDIITGGTQTNIAVTYDAQTKTVSFVAENGVADSTTDDLTEGTTNLYFTDQRAIDAVGGSATSENTPNTVVKRDGSGNFAAGQITANEIVVQTAGNIFEDSGLNITSTTGNDVNIYGSNDVNITTGNGDIVLNADGTAYITSAVSGNEIATKGWTSTNFDAAGSATTAENNAKSYADGLAPNYDPAGAATTAENNAKSYADGLAINYDPAGSAATAESAAKSYADGLAVNYDPAGSASTAEQNANNYTDGEITTALTTAQGYADQALSDANAYTDNAVSGLTWKQSVNVLATADVPLTGSTPLVVDSHTLNDGYRVLLTAQVADIEDGIYDLNITGGSYTLTRSADSDTNDELVGAAVYVMEGTQYGSTSWVQGNHYITGFAGQSWTQFSGQGTVTAGSGITVDGLEVSVNRTTVDGWYDAHGAAATAEANANDYTDTAISTEVSNRNSAITTAINALTTTDIEEGTNLYFTNTRAQDAVAANIATAISNGDINSTPVYAAIDINNVARQVAATTTVATAGEAVVHSFSKTVFRSAEYLVKVKNGTHTEISKILLTLDTSDNIAITEYGIVGTNGALATISAGINGGNVELKATTVNNTSTVLVAGTLLAEPGQGGGGGTTGIGSLEKGDFWMVNSTDLTSGQVGDTLRITYTGSEIDISGDYVISSAAYSQGNASVMQYGLTGLDTVMGSTMFFMASSWGTFTIELI